ncbi:TetR family transcriptional regulator [Zoogloea sp. LCSB751]|uniref:TetR family transcriptional regulator n=1 Tax=Zoogloea sp. LCSB751 TaxID=1965277 RepID=UPI0009A4D8F5|nr:TetR family transcriptional regulator [Zoogloea sp. LCSB751]
MVRNTKEEAELTRRHILDAARRVFLECGVARTTLERVAAAAGVTRGAVYWHFKNKTDLFFAMREQATLPFVDRVVFDEVEGDPLQGIERALGEVIHILSDEPETRETIEILSYKCEYVEEFSGLRQRTAGQLEFLASLAAAYRRAAAKGVLRAGFDPAVVAQDTFLFLSGLIKHWLSSEPGECFRADALDLIRSHVALRRA